MQKILISPSDIECCWEKDDACLVKTKIGKVWVCEKKFKGINTIDIIHKATNQYLVEIPLKRGGRNGE